MQGRTSVRYSDDPIKFAMQAAGLLPRPVMVNLRATDYERAAELIRQFGLTKGTGESPEGSFCTGGALAQAAYERTNESYLVIGGDRVARQMELDGYEAVQQWNDEPWRDQDDVVDRLEKTAKRLRNEGR